MTDENKKITEVTDEDLENVLGGVGPRVLDKPLDTDLTVLNLKAEQTERNILVPTALG